MDSDDVSTKTAKVFLDDRFHERSHDVEQALHKPGFMNHVHAASANRVTMLTELQGEEILLHGQKPECTHFQAGKVADYNDSKNLGSNILHDGL